MKRRDLLKAGLLLTAAGVVSSGCNKVKITSDNKELIIEPKQTDVYKMSAPIPYNFETIDAIANLNQKYKKSQFATLYNNIQRPCIRTFNDWLQVGDGITTSVTTFEEFAKYAHHALSSGIDVCYLLNSPKPYNEKDFNTFKDKLFWLLENLANAGIKNIKVGSTQTASIVNEFNPDFKLSTSTGFEFHDVSQYINIVESYPNINLIDVAIDENQNFTYLANLRKLFPNIAIEVMVNEPCIKGCPARTSHVSSINFSVFNCFELRNKRSMYYAFKSPAIYPWNLEYYSAIGINNFKFVIGKEGRGEYKEVDNLDRYMNCVENGIENYTIGDLFEDVIRCGNVHVKKDLKISQIIDYLPDIRHFIKQGDKCASSCGADCNYCDIKASKMEQLLKELGA